MKMVAHEELLAYPWAADRAHALVCRLITHEATSRGWELVMPSLRLSEYMDERRAAHIFRADAIAAPRATP